MGARASILIVDDEPQFRRVLKIALGAKGYAVGEASGGADAITLVRRDHFQLVLLDWQMPGLDGLETCHALREFSAIPIIMLTSKGESGREQALGAGADDYVSKPFELDRLLARVESALARQSDVRPTDFSY